jgi:hypothetical protein
MGGFVAELGKLLEGLFLGAVEVFRNLNANADVEIATTVSGERRDALIAKTENLVRGGPGRDFEFKFSVEAGDADFRSQGQLGKGDWNFAK